MKAVDFEHAETEIAAAGGDDKNFLATSLFEQLKTAVLLPIIQTEVLDKPPWSGLVSLADIGVAVVFGDEPPPVISTRAPLYSAVDLSGVGNGTLGEDEGIFGYTNMWSDKHVHVV